MSRQPAPDARQMSAANRFAPQGGRGRHALASRRAMWREPEVMKHGFAEKWARLLSLTFTGATEIALFFDVTPQAARYWLDGGICRASGHHVALAALHFPEDFRAVFGGEA